MIKGKSWPCQDYGAKSAPPIIFLHGFLGRGWDWQFVLPELARRYRCIFPDLPGHGENLPLSAKPLSFRRLAAALRRTLDDFGVQQCALVGYSMGGRLALYFALHYPERVLALVLESASPGLANRGERRERRELDDRRAAEITSGGVEKFVEEWYRMPLFASLQRQPGLVETLQQTRAENDAAAIARVVSELSPGRQPDLWGKLPGLRPPTLLLAGELDEKYLAMVHKMAGLIPQAEVAVAPQPAGHNVHLEMPGWYVKRLVEFY